MAFKFVFLTLFAVGIFATTCAGVIGSISYAHVPQTHVAAKVANPAVDAVALTHQNVVRSFGGTISQYSKTVDTPYSSVHKKDMRISNNVYTPANAKMITYTAPAKAVTYATAPAPGLNAYTHSVPAVSKALYTSTVDAASTGVVAVAPHTERHYPASVYASHEHYRENDAHHYAPLAVYANTDSAIHPVATKTVTVPVFKYHHHAPAVAAGTTTTTYNRSPVASTYSHNAPGLAAYGTSQTVRYSPAEMVSHMSFDGFGTHWGY